MPSKKTKAAAAAAALPPVPKELIDQFVTGPMSAEAVNAASMAHCSSTSSSNLLFLHAAQPADQTTVGRHTGLPRSLNGFWLGERGQAREI
jgi:hypothetical protein